MAELATEERTVRVLVVEDNPGDVRLVQEAFKEVRLPVDLEIATDGQEALDRLQELGTDGQRPDLVLLDLNLPRVHGTEVLAHIKQSEALRSLPVVVFSSSAAPSDVSEVYDRRANCYVQKPTELESYLDVVAKIETFWLSTCQLPR